MFVWTKDIKTYLKPSQLRSTKCRSWPLFIICTLISDCLFRSSRTWTYFQWQFFLSLTKQLNKQRSFRLLVILVKSLKISYSQSNKKLFTCNFHLVLVVVVVVVKLMDLLISWRHTKCARWYALFPFPQICIEIFCFLSLH